jgi:hypothetical protein
VTKLIEDVRPHFAGFGIEVREVQPTSQGGKYAKGSLPNGSAADLYAIVTCGPQGGEYPAGKGHGNGIVMDRAARRDLAIALLETL